MTDLCHQFLIQFTRHMGVAADRRAQYGSNGFPVCDIIVRENIISSMHCQKSAFSVLFFSLSRFFLNAYRYKAMHADESA